MLTKIVISHNFNEYKDMMSQINESLCINCSLLSSQKRKKRGYNIGHLNTDIQNRKVKQDELIFESCLAQI